MFRIIGEMVDKAHTFDTEAEAVAAADALAKAFPGRYYWVEELRWTEGYCAHVPAEGQDVAAELEAAISNPPPALVLLAPVQDEPATDLVCASCGAPESEDKCRDDDAWVMDAVKAMGARWVQPSALPEVYHQIMRAAEKPVARRGNIRRESRKFIAAQLRMLFRDLGIKGISVTAPNYSMAQSVEVKLPEFPRTTWHRKSEATKALMSIILQAHPDLDDRSDTQSDYFDYRISMN